MCVKPSFDNEYSCDCKAIWSYLAKMFGVYKPNFGQFLALEVLTPTATKLHARLFLTCIVLMLQLLLLDNSFHPTCQEIVWVS